MATTIDSVFDDRHPTAVVEASPAGTPFSPVAASCKRFGPVEALIDVGFDVRDGEVVALVGDERRRQVHVDQGDLGHPAGGLRGAPLRGRSGSNRKPG